MRVVAGRARGMKLECPPGNETRPTPEAAREALFNILREYVDGTVVLDVFAGSGAVGIEALSRGAARCVFVERSARTRQSLEKNLEHTRLAEFADVLQRDAFYCVDAVARLDLKFDLVYLGPPFPLWHNAEHRAALVALLDEIAAAGLLVRDAVLVAQYEPGVELPEETECLRRYDERKYGRNLFAFYELKTEDGGQGSGDEG